MTSLRLIGCAVAIGASVATAQPSLPASQLAARIDGTSHVFWRSDAAPDHWTHAPLAALLQWQRKATGVETAEVLLAGTGEAWRTKLTVVRLDPSQLDFSLDTAATPAGTPAWKIARAPHDAVFAVNADQFRSTQPWGLLVLDGHRILPPERAPLAVTIAIDSSGGMRWIVNGDRAPEHVRWAFQSYPALLHDHAVPSALRGADRGVDVAHRDARLAIGRLSSGKLVVALTRFDGLGEILGAVPFGLTAPEMAGVMGALGANDAVLLDGGISAQLMAGVGEGRIALSGWRDVPLALIARVKMAP